MESSKPLLVIPMLLAVALPACDANDASDVGSVEARAIVFPDVCDPPEPTCHLAREEPQQTDLSTANSGNVFVAGGGLSLFAGSGSIVDSDGDGVPDAADDCDSNLTDVDPSWRSCDGDASNDGLYQTLFYDAGGTVTLAADISVSATIAKADAYILMDSSGSMKAEQDQLVADLRSGTFLTAEEQVSCPDGIDKGLIGAMTCAVSNLWFGVGQFNEIPLVPHADPFDQSPYHHHLDMTDNFEDVSQATARLVTTYNKDDPEAATQAIYSTVTGRGLGPWVPNRGACPAVPAGRWGYPCFRPGALPIIMLFTDEDMYNGPRAESPSYDSPINTKGGSEPPFDRELSKGMEIPPVEQFPQVLRSNDADTALDLGDLTGKSVTIMGTNAEAFANSYETYLEGDCLEGTLGEDAWGDGLDAAIRFSLSATTNVTLSGESTFYNKHNVAIADNTDTILDCDHGGGPSNYWGSLQISLDAGDYLAISDAAVDTDDKASKQVGPYQLRIQTTTPPADGSWLTTDAPVAWPVIEQAINDRGVKFVSVISEGHSSSGGELSARPDAEALGILTNSVDQFGQPYLEEIEADGSGLSLALLEAVRSLVGDTRRDVSLIARDNPATAVDESQFVKEITPLSCPTSGINNCTGVSGNTCIGCLGGTIVSFQFRLGNDVVPQTGVDQIFDFDMVGIDGNGTELGSIPVRVMVPAAGTDFSPGFYETVYDSSAVCLGPPARPDPERPDWGTLTVTGTTPADSSIEFVLTTADTMADLASAAPVSVTVPADATGSFDVREALLSAGEQNFRFMLGVRANLIPSSGGNETPLLAGWTVRFDCLPVE